MLIDPTREFRLEGDVFLSRQDKVRKSIRHLFLFNDLLLITKKKDTKGKEKENKEAAAVAAAGGGKPVYFTMKNWMTLTDVLIRRLEDNPQQST